MANTINPVTGLTATVSGTTISIAVTRPLNTLTKFVTGYKFIFHDYDGKEVDRTTSMPTKNGGSKLIGSITEPFEFKNFTRKKYYSLTVTPYIKNPSGSISLGTAFSYVNSKAPTHINTIYIPDLVVAPTGPIPPSKPTGPSGSTGATGSTGSTGSPTLPKTDPKDLSKRQLITLVHLHPNLKYNIKVFAIKTNSDGTIEHSPYSNVLQIKTPSSNPSGSNFFAPNNGTDIALTGGSIFAGSFPPNTGSIDVTKDGETTGSGVILNKTGLAGYANGVKEFYIDAVTGRAYFAGNVTAGEVKIGPNIDPTGTLSGIYINETNYWYDDGSFRTTFGNIANIITPDPAGTGPVVDLNPDAVTNLVATWNGLDLIITFDFDASTLKNKYATNFSLRAIAQGSEKVFEDASWLVNKTSTNQSITLTESLNGGKYGITQVIFSLLGITVIDSFSHRSTETTISGPTYISPLPAPSINLTAAVNGYSVAFTAPTDKSYNAIAIEEVESISSTDPGTGYERVYFDTINPAVIKTTSLNQRWVRAKFSSTAGIFSDYSVAKKITPLDFQNVDRIPPSEASSVSASWSGDNILLSYTLPSSDAGTRFIVELTNTSGKTGNFYFYPVGTSTSQTYVISETDLYSVFGGYFNSFTGLFKSVDIADNRSQGVSFSVTTKSNPIASVKPTFTLIPISNSYSVSFDLPAGASRAEVYQRYISWGAISDPMDSAVSSFASGGTSGSNTITIGTLISYDGSTVTDKAILKGYKITGTGIPANTYITNVSSNTITLNKNLTAQAAGSYTFASIVYSGVGPAVIPELNFQTVYVKIRYYTKDGSESLISDEQSTTSLDPTAVNATAPNVPVLSAPSSDTTSVTLSISTTDIKTKGYYVQYKTSTGSLYTTELIPGISFTSGTSTTSYVVKNLTPGTTYNFKVASIDQYNNVSSYSSPDVTKATSTQTLSAPTSAVLSAISYGIRSSWTAPASPSTPISKYKVELYNAANTLLFTDFTFSTNYDFTGLSSSTTYYIKVYTQDIYNVLSTALTSSSITLNAAGGASNGSAPSSSPTPTLTSLFGALQVNWTPVTSGNDLVTYEIHVSTTSGFTPDRIGTTTKATEANGSFAIIRTLPSTGSILSYGTNYYVKIVAKDFDGAATASTEVLGTTSKIDNGDIATNAVRANQIFAGSINADKVDAANLFVGKTFSVGSGIGVYDIKIDASSSPYRLYSGSGTYGAKSTAFYLDNTGQFSLKDVLTFSPDVSTASGTLTVNGVINANSGNFAGYMTVNSGTMKIGTAAGGPGNHGIYITPDNYWYSNGYFKVGSSTLGISYSAGTFAVTGALTATSASIGTLNVQAQGGAVYIGSALNSGSRIVFTSTDIGMYTAANSGDAGTKTTYLSSSTSSLSPTFYTTSALIGGWTVGANIFEASNSSASGSYIGLSSNGAYAIYAGGDSGGGGTPKFTVTKAGAVIASDIKITAGKLDIGADAPSGFHVSNAGVLTATGVDIVGRIKATSGELGTLTVTGDITAGTVGGARVSITPTGISVWDGSATPQRTTYISGTAGAGGVTFSTDSATIGKWDVNTTGIYKTNGYGTLKLDSGLNAIYSVNTGTTTYTAGLSAGSSTSPSDIVFWAGTAGIASSSNNFYVTRDGTLNAAGAVIGGTSKINNVTASDITRDAAKGATALQSIPSNYLTTSTSISGGQITTGTIKNGSFPGTGSTQASDGSGFSVSGMSINLDNSSITSPNFRIVGSGVNGQTAGTAYFRGTIGSGSTITGSSFSTPSGGIFLGTNTAGTFDWINFVAGNSTASLSLVSNGLGLQGPGSNGLNLTTAGSVSLFNSLNAINITQGTGNIYLNSSVSPTARGLKNIMVYNDAGATSLGITNGAAVDNNTGTYTVGDIVFTY